MVHKEIIDNHKPHLMIEDLSISLINILWIQLLNFVLIEDTSCFYNHRGQGLQTN